MATFTMTLQELVGVDNPSHADATKIGLDDYPIWDERYRGELNKKIVMRFWFREIGFETPGMFVHHVRRLMHEIMPYYNRLQNTTFEFDPFETVNITNESEATANAIGSSENTADVVADGESDSQTQEASESSQTQSSESVSRNVNSEHPQTRLNEFENYATSSSDAGSESASQSEGDASGTSETRGTQHSTQNTTANTRDQQDTTTSQKDRQQGFSGNKNQLLQQYRELIIGVDNQILNELETLFMGVWDADQRYTRLGEYDRYSMFHGPLF